MSNVLNAILNIAELSTHTLVDDNLGRNRINNIGKSLETFIADIFAGTVDEKEQKQKLQKQA